MGSKGASAYVGRLGEPGREQDCASTGGHRQGQSHIPPILSSRSAVSVTLMQCPGFSSGSSTERSPMLDFGVPVASAQMAQLAYPPCFLLMTSKVSLSIRPRAYFVNGEAPPTPSRLQDGGPWRHLKPLGQPCSVGREGVAVAPVVKEGDAPRQLQAESDMGSKLQVCRLALLLVGVEEGGSPCWVAGEEKDAGLGEVDAEIGVPGEFEVEQDRRALR